MPRATPKSIEERRKDIIAVALPLIERDGAGVSTRRIADGAGIAEGTLFRVFPTKVDLLKAAVDYALDPAEIVRQLDLIDRALPLEERLLAVLTIARRSTRQFRALIMYLRGLPHPRPFGPGGPGHTHDPAAFRGLMAQVQAAIESVLAPDANRFAVTLPQAAAFVMAQTLPLGAQPMFERYLGLTTLVPLIVRALIDPRKESIA